MELFDKALDTFLLTKQQRQAEVDKIGFSEDLETNLISQICLFLLTLKAYKKKELIIEQIVILYIFQFIVSNFLGNGRKKFNCPTNSISARNICQKRTIQRQRIIDQYCFGFDCY